MDLIIFIMLVALGYIAGSIAEKKHYISIEKREKEQLNLPAVTIQKALDADAIIDRTLMVHGSVVISLDYFKRVLASLINLMGGEMTPYETLVDRARREAILRMKEMAPGFDLILNTRIETSSIGKSANKKKSMGSIEVLAYGTAVRLKGQQ